MLVLCVGNFLIQPVLCSGELLMIPLWRETGTVSVIIYYLNSRLGYNCFFLKIAICGMLV